MANANIAHRKLNAQRRRATPPWADLSAIRALYVEAAYRTAKQGEVYVVEPVIPLKHPKVCGLHVPANLRVMLLDDVPSKGEFDTPQLEMVL